jgi:hypothetical protein
MDKLGTILECKSEGEPTFCLCFITKGFNFRPDLESDYLSYEALEKALKLVNVKYKNKKIACPLLGSSRFDGNGDKGKIMEIFNNTLSNVECTIFDYFQKSRAEEMKEVRDNELAVKKKDRDAYYKMVGERKKKAEERFTESLKNNPPEDKLCKVYENLSLSIEKQADERLGAELYRDAIDLYSRAESVLYANGCADKDNAKGKSAKSGIAKDRIDEKRNDAVNALNKSTDDGDSTPEEARKKDVTDGDLENSKKNKVAPNSRALGVQYIESLINGTGRECSVPDGDMCW